MEEELKKAIKEVLEIIESYSKEDLENILENSKGSEFAITVDFVRNLNLETCNFKTLDDDFQKVLSENLLDLF